MKQHVEDYGVEHMAMMCKAFADLQQAHADLIQAHAVVVQCLQDANLAVPHQSLPVSVVDQLRKQACRPLQHSQPHTAPGHTDRPASKVFPVDDEDTTVDIERRRQEEPSHHGGEQRSQNADPRRQSLTRNVAMAVDRNQEFLIDLSNDDDDDVLGDKDYCGP